MCDILGWKYQDFDDLDWEDATVLGANGISPWGSIGGIDSNAQWIWTAAGPADPNIYCRINLRMF